MRWEGRQSFRLQIERDLPGTKHMGVPVNIGDTLYQTLVRYAEGGERVVKVVLPDALYVEFLADTGTTHMMRTLGVEVVSGNVQAPKFFAGESK